MAFKAAVSGSLPVTKSVLCFSCGNDASTTASKPRRAVWRGTSGIFTHRTSGNAKSKDNLPHHFSKLRIRVLRSCNQNSRRLHSKLEAARFSDDLIRVIETLPSAGYKNAVIVEQSRRQDAPFITASEGSGSLRSVLDDEDTCLGHEQSLVLPGSSNVSPKLLHVAVDVDEVLGSFLATLNTFIAEEYLLHHKLSEYHVYDFMKIWKCSQAEANSRVHAFFESEHFNNGILPIPGAHPTLLRLALYCHLVVVTSRQHVIRKPTLEWIEQHYPSIFKGVHFGNHFALEGKARPKSEICRSLGVEILIDDNPKYALECAEHGIEVLLFDLDGSYPWSKTAQGPTHPLITRVRDWPEVERALYARHCPKLEESIL